MSPTSKTTAGTLLAAFAMVSTGTICNPDPGPDPCELDRLGCEDPGPSDPAGFYLESCPAEIEGALEVVAGSGEIAFESFAEGAGPIVHFGPQGGQHVFMGFRVDNARVDVSPRLRVSFYLGQGEGCAPPSDPASTAIPTCAVTLGKRDVVLGGTGFELRHNAEGQVEEYGLVVFVDVPSSDLAGLVAVSVEDQCRRKGAAFQAWTRY